MCIAKRSGLEVIAVGVTSGRFLKENHARWGVTIFPPATNPVTVTDQGTATATNGVTFRAGMPPMTFNVRDHGDFWAKPLMAIAVGGAETIGVIEINEREYETAPPETPIVRE